MSARAMEPVRLLVTGGTIDKTHEDLTESFGFPTDAGTYQTEILREGRADAIVETLFMKDSNDIDEADRLMIWKAVLAAPERALVITHGTSRMAETARYLAPLAQKEAPQKTVVLTGAMRPYSFGRSDAPFNLGGAMVAAQCAGPGVFAVMNGRLFPAEAVQKNTEIGRFDR